jgi:MarR family 2-MHQ and catechol resistance regulon transcriptional repressor
MAQATVDGTEQPGFISLMDELAHAHHKLSLFEAEIHRLSGSGLTAPQAKVIFCLGNTDGLTCSEITEQTLITKGTLTGVIDRLEQKNLVQRWSDAADGRRIIVDLSRTGKRLFSKEYPKFLQQMQPRFDSISQRSQKQASSLLGRIADQF